MTKQDKIGWFGNSLFIIGAILLAYKSPLGFVCNATANVCYIMQGIIVNTKSLWVLSIVLVIINLYALYKWLF